MYRNTAMAMINSAVILDIFEGINDFEKGGERHEANRDKE